MLTRYNKKTVEERGMHDLATVRELFAYAAWADAIVWSAVLGSTASADEPLP
jgi:hypothetical protein